MASTPSVPEPPESPRLFRPRRVTEILAHAFALYREHWQNLIATVAIIVIPLAVLQVLLVDLVIGEAFIETRDGVEVADGSVLAAVLGSIVVAVFSVLMWAIVTGAITRASAGTFLGRDLDVRESYRYGLARLGSIILVGLLAGLAIAGGLLLLIIPGLFFLTMLTCSLPALVIEDRRGTAALGRSWNLVKGFGWHVFATIVVAGLLTGIAGGILTAPFGDNTFARGIGQAIASTITMPYTALVGILIYLDLRVRKERYGPADLDGDLARTAAS
ncbi:MAG TPA: hypothetical protein VID69_07580 [Actinomycetota bacterium]|jgi:hypothetical protein